MIDEQFFDAWLAEVREWWEETKEFAEDPPSEMTWDGYEFIERLMKHDRTHTDGMWSKELWDAERVKSNE